MKSFQRYCGVWLAVFIAGACIEPYDPPVDDRDVNFLVVDGFINATDGTASVKLTRTLPVASKETIPAESGAHVSIEDEQGVTSLLTETETGVYTGWIADISFDTRYRLIIRTRDSNEYASDLISLQETPPIDSISYSAVTDGLEFAVSTHDVTRQSRYFRWKFWETYEYHSSFNSSFMFSGKDVVIRPADQSLFTCWRTIASSSILIGSTEHLSESVISKFPVTVVPEGSVKLSLKYSLLVRQQSLSPEAYNYWLNLQKSTEQLGGLFDPLPSEVRGNMHSTKNPTEKVIGFLSGGSVQETRIFLTYRDLPDELKTYNSFNPNCLLDTLSLMELATAPASIFLVDAVYGEFTPDIVGYSTSTRECIDCTSFGGTPKKPDFWQ